MPSFSQLERAREPCRGRTNGKSTPIPGLYGRAPGNALFTAPRVSNTIFGPPRCSSQVQLMILRRYGFARQVLIVEDCVEYQSVGADGLATIDGVVAEQQHVPAT